ncbi:MAG: RHS repeat-associated core domain-containing protein, partial [Burkholderiales bacterium]
MITQIADSVAGNTTLTYDPQGNLKQKLQGTNNTNFVWSARDLITEISRNGSVLGKYASDHAGMRVSKEAINPLQPGAPPRVLRTQWDEQQAIQDRDSSGTVIARYDFAGRHPVALWSAENGNQHLHADALGSIVATTNPSGTVQSETLYDAWGNPTTKTGASANKFAYTGHQADAETGLYYFKARYYDPEIGRFISQDPADGQDGKPASYHRYLYAYANPTVYIDPTGLYSWREFGRDFGDNVATTAGLATGLALGVASSTVEGVVGLSEAYNDLNRARAGDPFAQQRNVQRGKALLHAVTNPGEMARRAKNYINTEEAGAAREYGDGNAFTAGVVRGKVVGEVATVLIPGVDLGVS